MAVIFISFLFGLPTSVGLVLSHRLSCLQASGVLLAISVLLPIASTLCVLAVQRIRARVHRSTAAHLEHAGPP
jgi:hypothetical protein